MNDGDRPPWQEQARCNGEPWQVFFPPRARNGISPERAAAAKRICAVCPVKAECLTDGLDERYGIWGGMTPNERRVERERRGLKQIRRPEFHLTYKQRRSAS